MMPFRALTVFSVFTVLMTACSSPQPTQDMTLEKPVYQFFDMKELTAAYRRPIEEWPPMELDKGVVVDDLAPITSLPKTRASKEKIALGAQLFFDPRLSSSGQIACASCHDPELGWGDGRRVAYGHKRLQGNRNAMTILNARYFSEHFWDGRAKGLRNQATQPVENPVEMHESIENMLVKLNDIIGYQDQFAELYQVETIEKAHVEDAIASFEETIVSRKSRFDRFMLGDYSRLSDTEIHGLHLYRTKARCIQCHSGALMSDDKYHNIGLSYYGRKYEDLGRYALTQKREDMGAFRTPSLRDLVYTGPYMHNGLFPHLRGVINMYNNGMTIGNKRKPGGPILDPLIQPLELSPSERQALEAFLVSASFRPMRIRPPKLPE